MSGGICPLLGIPRELRDLFYVLCLDEELQVTVFVGQQEKHRTNEFIRPATPRLLRTHSLLLVSHQLYDEARPVHVKRMRFGIEVGDTTCFPLRCSLGDSILGDNQPGPE